MYDAVAGRFVSRDPIGYVDGTNRYLYVNNRPYFFVDPDGRLGHAVIHVMPPPVQVFVGGFGVGYVVGKPFWDWVFAPKPWQPTPKPIPVPRPKNCPKGFEPHPDNENFPRRCFNTFIQDVDQCAFDDELCWEENEHLPPDEAERICKERFDECKADADADLYKCSSESPDWVWEPAPDPPDIPDYDPETWPY
jgi:hypothetical protein